VPNLKQNSSIVSNFGLNTTRNINNSTQIEQLYKTGLTDMKQDGPMTQRITTVGNQVRPIVGGGSETEMIHGVEMSKRPNVFVS